MQLIRLLRHELPAEADEWVRCGFIEGTQAEAILKHYGVTAGVRRSLPSGQNIIGAVGALFIALALFLIIGRNWEEIAREVRLIALVGGTLALQISAVVHWIRGNEAKGRLLAFFGCVSYGASIFLISQLYHLSGYVPEALYFWALGIAPFLLVMRTPLLHYLFSTIALLYLAYAGADGYRALGYPLLAGLSAYLLVTDRESKLLFLSVLAGSVYFLNLLLPELGTNGYGYNRSEIAALRHLVFTAGCAVIIQIVSRCFEGARNANVCTYALVARIWSLRFNVGLLLLLSCEPAAKELARTIIHFPYLLLVINAAVAAACGIALASIYRRAARPSVAVEVAGACALFSISVAGILLKGGQDSGDLLSLVASTALLVKAALLIREGHHAKQRSAMMLGAFLLCALGAIRYFDLFGGYIVTAAILAVAGAALIISGRLLGFRRERV